MMIYVIGLLVGILAFIRKKDKKVFFLVFLYAFSIFAFNTDNPDLVNYQNQYLGFFDGCTEPIYIGLGLFCRGFGFDFWIFRGIVAFIGLVLISGTICKYSPYPNLNLFLFILYPLVIDVVQIRFFLAYSLIVHSIRYIINYQESKKTLEIIKFAMSLLLATGIHYSAIMYIILIILFLNVNKNKTLVYIVIPALIILAFTKLSSLGNFVSILLADRKVNRWILGNKDITKLNLIRIVVSRSSVILVLFLFKFVKKDTKINIENQLHSAGALRDDFCKKKYFAQNRIFFGAALYTELYCFLEIVVASEYERLTRPALVWGGILATRLLYRMESNNRKICTIIWILLIICYFLSQMLFQGVRFSNLTYIDHVFKRVMENNILYP